MSLSTIVESDIHSIISLSSPLEGDFIERISPPAVTRGDISCKVSPLRANLCVLRLSDLLSTLEIPAEWVWHQAWAKLRNANSAGQNCSGLVFIANKAAILAM
jgi:hypothetical protein